MHKKPRYVSSAFRLLLALGAMGSIGSSLLAQTSISYAKPAVLQNTSVTSTSGSSDLTVSTGTWAVGDIIQFYGTSATTNPFGTASARYYVVSVAGSTLRVSTTPGGTALNATNTTTASTIRQGQDWLTGSNWTGGVAPNGNSTIATFDGQASSVPGIVVNGNVTIYGLNNTNTLSGTDVTLLSGANGTARYALTFATNDASTPKMTLGDGNFLTFLGASGNAGVLKIAGTQGLIFNSMTGGAITGSGTSATSTAPGKQTRITNVDWTDFSGGLTVERGVVQIQAANQLPNQTFTIGNAQTVTNNTLAGLSMNGQSATVDALAGNSLGRVYNDSGTLSTLTVGGNGGSGEFAGVIGKNFPGTGGANIAITKTGSGTQTLSGDNAYTGATLISTGTLKIGHANALGTTAGTTTISSGATLDLNGQTITEVLSLTGAGVGGNGALINSNTGAAAVVNSESTNGASFTVGGAGDLTLQRARSGGSPMIVTKTGTGTLTLGNGSTTNHMNLLAVDVTSASTVNFAVSSGNFLVADRGLRIGAGGTVNYTGTSTNFIGDNQEVIVSHGTLNLNGLDDAIGTLSIGNGTTNGTLSGGSASTVTVSGSYQAFGAGGSTLSGGIAAMSGSVDVVLAGAAALTKTTSGTVNLSQANTYTGATTVSAGTLTIDATGSLVAASAVSVTGGTLLNNGTISGSVTVDSGATLGGSGTFAGAVIVNGNFNPGTSPGLATFTNDLTLAGTSLTTMEINGTSRGGTYDAIDVTGALTYGGSLALAFGASTSAGANYQLFDFGSTSGSFSSVYLSGVYAGSLALSGQTWSYTDVGNNLLFTLDQSTGYLSVATAIPEPSTYAALAGLGALGLALLRRRQRRAS